MSLNPLAPVTDYQSMLNRIFWFTSATALVAVWMFRLYLPALDAILRKLDFSIAFGSDRILPLPAGYLLPALAIGLCTRIYRLHARLSDWLGIRESFDIDVIIAEFADRLAVDLSRTTEAQLRAARHDIMRRAFYPYVGGDQPQIDRQLIEQALDAWSWFWIGVEATLVFTLLGLALIAYGVYQPGFASFTSALAFAAIGLPTIRGQCRRYAVAQVRAILADRTRAVAARTAFAELTSDTTQQPSIPLRRAA